MKRAFAISVFTVMFIAAAATILPAQQTSDDFLKLGNDKYRAKDFNGAVAAFSECVKLNPRGTACLYNRSLSHYALSNWDAAIADSTAVVGLDPRHADAYVRRGLARTKKELYKDAAADYEASLKINPNDEPVKKALSALQDLIKTKGELEQKQAELKKLQESQKVLAGLMLSVGDKHVADKKYDDAITAYTSCLSGDPLMIECFINRSVAYNLKNEPDKALLDLGAAILLQPSNADLYLRRGSTYRDKKKDDALALKDFDKAVSLAPNASSPYLQRGITHLFRGTPAAAITDFDQAIKLKPTDAHAHFVRGYAYEQNNNKPAAIADYKKALSLNPNHAEAKQQLAALEVSK